MPVYILYNLMKANNFPLKYSAVFFFHYVTLSKGDIIITYGYNNALFNFATCHSLLTFGSKYMFRNFIHRTH